MTRFEFASICSRGDWRGLFEIIFSDAVTPPFLRYSTMWTSPDRKTLNEIEVNWRTSLHDVRVYRGADVGKDHNLVVGKIYLKLKKITKTKAGSDSDILGRR